LAWVLGCAASAPPPPTLAPEPDEPSGLVWLSDAHGRHRTLWVSTEDGRPLSSLPIEGPLWAEGSMLWQWIEEPVEVPLVDCRASASEPVAHAGLDDSPSEVIGTAIGYRVVLRELTQSLSLEVRGPPRVEPVRALSHGVEPVASVGPYLFAREQLAYAPCDARQSAEARALVWDLSTAGPIEVLSARERAAVAARARASFRERGLEPVNELELAALAPRWDPRRGLQLDVLFMAGVDRSATVRARRLPSALAARARVPAWVRTAVARVEGATLLGFSRLDHPAPIRVLDALRR